MLEDTARAGRSGAAGRGGRGRGGEARGAYLGVGEVQHQNCGEQQQRHRRQRAQALGLRRTAKKGAVLSHEGSGNTKQRQCRSQAFGLGIATSHAGRRFNRGEGRQQMGEGEEKIDRERGKRGGVAGTGREHGREEGLLGGEGERESDRYSVGGDRVQKQRR